MANNENNGSGGKSAIILIGACLIIALMVALAGETQPFTHGKGATKVPKGELVPGQLSEATCQDMMKSYAEKYVEGLANAKKSNEAGSENIQVPNLKDLSVAEASTILEKFFNTPPSCQCDSVMKKPMSATIQWLREDMRTAN